MNAYDFQQLDKNESEFLGGPLTENEVLSFPKKMKHDKSPEPVFLHVYSLFFSGTN